MGFSLKKLGREFSRPFEKVGREIGRVAEKDLGIKGAQKFGEKVGRGYGGLVGGETLAKTYDKIGEGADKLITGITGDPKLGGMVGGSISSPYNYGDNYQTQALQAQVGAAGGAGTPTGQLTPEAIQASGAGSITTGALMQAQSQLAAMQGQAGAPQGQGLGAPPGAGAPALGIGQPSDLTPSGTKLQRVAQQMAENYGFPVGNQPVVDAQGNLTVLPQNADQAVQLQMISQAVANEQTRQAQQRAVAAIQAGFGQFQKRGYGSMAVLQTGLYENLANLYANEEYEAADFSYYIEKEAQMRQEAILARQQKEAKRKGTLSGLLGIAGAVVGYQFGGFAGAQAGFQMGSGAGGLF